MQYRLGFDDLPDELILKIYNFLEANQAIDRFSRTCWRMKNLSTQVAPPQIKPFLLKHYTELHLACTYVLNDFKNRVDEHMDPIFWFLFGFYPLITNLLALVQFWKAPSFLLGVANFLIASFTIGCFYISYVDYKLEKNYQLLINDLNIFARCYRHTSKVGYCFEAWDSSISNNKKVVEDLQKSLVLIGSIKESIQQSTKIEEIYQAHRENNYSFWKKLTKTDYPLLDIRKNNNSNDPIDALYLYHAYRK